MNNKEKRELAISEIALVALGLVGLAVVIWLAWLRPEHKAKVTSYAACVSAGNPVQESYPEVCVAKDGTRFVNPEQKVANPPQSEQKYLNITQWNVRIPLTAATADLTYTYDKNDTYDGAFFGFRRLADAGVCVSGVGVALTRTTTANQAPYTIDNPAVFKKVGGYYYYESFGGAPCYDPNDAKAVKLVNQINGGDLKEAVTGALQNLESAPAQ